MPTCSCGASFSGYGYKCQSCLTRETIEKEGEKNRRQNESIARENAALAQQQSYEQRRQMQQLEQQQYAIAAQQQETARQQMFLESQRLEETKKNNRLLIEQSITIEEAFAEGASVVSFTNNLFQNDVNFYYDNPYLTPKLNKAFANGAQQRIADYSSDNMWLNLLKSKINSIAIEYRKLFLEHEDGINEVNAGIFYIPVEVDCNGVSVDYGNLVINLQVAVEESTGEISFVNQEFANVTYNDEINKLFDAGFEFENVLNLVNEKNKKLRRLELILIDKIAEYSAFLEVQKSNNDTVTWKNLRALSAYAAVAYGFYLIANGSILNAIGVWFASFFVAGGFWSIESGYNMTKGRSTLATLKSFLVKTKGELYGIPDGSLSSDAATISLESVPKSNLLKKILLLILLLVVLFAAAIQFKPSLLPKSVTNIFAFNLPDDVTVFLQKKESCDHFLSEPAYDQERKKFLKESIQKYCPNTDPQFSALKVKYKENKAVSDKLSNYSTVGILETGAPVGISYQGLRKNLLATNWKPWKFIPIDGYVPPFPEVMDCDEGYCHAYFINKNGNLVLKVSYKVCGSEYIGNCSGYENGFLMIDDFETISLEEAKRLNKVTKDHFG